MDGIVSEKGVFSKRKYSEKIGGGKCSFRAAVLVFFALFKVEILANRALTLTVNFGLKIWTG